MRKTLIYLFLLIPFISRSQDYAKMAVELQQKHKDEEAAILKSDISYDFLRDFSKSTVKVVEKKSKKLLSLRYNYTIPEVEVYDQNSQIQKFYAVSNLKQKASEDAKFCGTYTNEGYFYDDSKFCMHQLKLKELGEIWDVNSIKKIYDAKYLTTIYFEENYPVLEKNITFSIPSELEVEIREFNLADFSISKSEKVVGGIKILEYSAKELPGRENEKMARGMQFNHPHLLVMVKSMKVSGKQVNVLSSPQDLYSWYSSLTKSLIPKPEIFQPTVAALIKGKENDEEKVKAIYYWVQDNIRYIAFENGIAGFKPDEAHNVFEKKYGDCKGMANLTKEMLKVAGFDARLTWIGTKMIMYDSSIPSLSINNHMICTVFLNGKRYFLDATEKYIPFGVNADRIQNRPVMIEDGDAYILDKIPDSGKLRDIEVKEMTMKINGTQLEGNYTVTLNGESKKNFLYTYHYTKNDGKEEYLSDFITDNNNNVKIANVKLPDLEKRSGSSTLECSYTFTSGLSSFNNELYLDIDPAKYFKNWDVKETRQSDIDFGQKIYKKYLIELQIPEGYKVSHLPGNLKISDPEFSFIINYKIEENKIIYSKELIIEEGVIQKSSFVKWNASIKQLEKAYQNQIVFSK